MTRKILNQFVIITGICLLFSCESNVLNLDDERFVNFVTNPSEQDLNMYWKNPENQNYYTFSRLKDQLAANDITLIFAANGGMFTNTYAPQGLYIEHGEVHSEIDRMQEGYGNFYMQPNGVFYITKMKEAKVTTTNEFELAEEIEYATQSGPMLLIDGEIHAVFNEGSKNLNIRNGVGILPNGDILFAMSKTPINFFDFATYFKDNGCKNALYLDGLVSRTYLPSINWIPTDGKFGVIIGVTEPKQIEP